jgi:hypothetical protein
VVLSACVERTDHIPDGYMDECSGDSGCAEGLSCLGDTGYEKGSVHLCSSPCQEDADCPEGTKVCGDGVANECRHGMCYYSLFCY